MENLISIGMGGLGGLITYAVARLLLNGKYMSKEACKINHEMFDRMFDRLLSELSTRLERLERKIDRIMEED